MKKKSENSTIILFIIIIATILLISCTEQKVPNKKPTTISIGNWIYIEEHENDKLKKFIEEKFNIRLKIVPVSGYYWESDYKEKIIANQLPDLFYSDYLANSTYDYIVKNNLVKEISTTVKGYPNIEEYMNNPYFDYFKDSEGLIYCMPRIGYNNDSDWGLNRVFLLRKDWMEKGNITMPESYKEFKEMLTYFRDGDPDGNGLDDTYGLELENASKIEALYLGINPYFCNIERAWIYEDEKWIPVWCSKKMGTMLAYFNDLYESGLLHPDFALMNSTQALYDFVEGKVGCIAYPYIPLLNNYPEFHDFTEDNVIIMHPWKIKGNDRPYRFTTTKHWSEIYINSKISNEKLQKIYSLIDYLLSDEFDDDINENEFWKEDSFRMFFEFVDYNMVDYFKEGYVPLSEGLESYFREEQRWAREDADPVDYNWEVMLKSTPSKSRLPSNIEVHNAIVRAVLSSEPVEQAWKHELEKLKENYPIDAAIEEVTALHTGI